MEILLFIRVQTSDNAHIGKANESELVSTLDPKNYKFWKIRDKEFRSAQSPFDISSSDNEYFKNKKNSGQSVKDICKEAYNKDNNTSTSDAAKPKKEEVIKFCGFKEEN